MSETTLWVISAASFLTLLFIELWNKWAVLWRCFQRVMPVPLRSDTPKNGLSGAYVALPANEKPPLRAQVLKLRSDLLAVLASGPAIGNVEQAFILAVVDNMNILRARLEREGHQVLDRCEATPTSIQKWHDFLQNLLETDLERPSTEPTVQQEPLRKFDVADYSEYTSYLLYEAACLWVGIKPHHPVRDYLSEVKLGQLKSAIRDGDLLCQWQNGLLIFLNFLSGRPTTLPNPSDHQPVPAIALRRYADSIGEVPAFLRNVQVPVELPPAEGNAEDEAKDITPPKTGAGDNIS